MKFNKQILLYISVIIFLLLLTSVSAVEMKLDSGNKINIPDEYYATYQNDSSAIYVEVYPIGVINILDSNKLSYEGKLKAVNAMFERTDYHNVTIAGKNVLECYHGKNPKGAPMYTYFVDGSDNTVTFIVGVNPDKQWNVTDVNNPIYRLIEGL